MQNVKRNFKLFSILFIVIYSGESEPHIPVQSEPLELGIYIIEANMVEGPFKSFRGIEKANEHIFEKFEVLYCNSVDQKYIFTLLDGNIW